MYSKEEASQLKRKFWTTFGGYIAPQLSSEGLKVNWLNYKTGLKNIYFRMDADQNKASLSIEITHDDLEIQELFFEQFLEFKNILHTYLNEEWEWLLHVDDGNGKVISKIHKEIHEINIFKNNDWPVLISFFKPRITALDEFWNDVKYSFDTLK